MKKIISLIAATFIFLIPLNIRADESSLTFFDNLENLNKLESYKVNQSIFGGILLNKLPMDDGFVDLKGDYNFTLNDVVESKGAWQNNTHAKIEGRVKLAGKSTTKNIKMCDEYSMEVRGEAISIFNESIYLKLDNLNIKGKKCDKTEQADIDSAMEQVKEFEGKWFRLGLSDLTASEYYDVPDQTEITDALQEDGIENGIMDITAPFLDEVGLSDEEISEVKTLIDTVFQTEFFSSKTITNGNNAGFTSFKLNKSALLNLALDLSRQFGQEITQMDMNNLRAYLNKFTIDGMYKVNEEYGIYDNFLMHFGLWNIENLKKLDLNYRYKVSGINNMPAIEAPTDFVDIDSGMLPYFQSESTSSDFDVNGFTESKFIE
jgi:hypothetical protein